MNAKTLKALKGSIKHWQENLRAAKGHNEITKGAYFCPLCDIFYIIDGQCTGCPVKEKTKMRGCIDTPYYDVTKAIIRGNQQEIASACQAEIDFLKSLLPDGK